MSSRRVIGVVLVTLSGVPLAACDRSSNDAPTAREVVIVDDTHIEISVWCADPPPTMVRISESESEIRVTVVKRGNDDCETAKTITLSAPLGSRTIVDAGTGRPLPIRLDSRCVPAAELVRCDGIDTPEPPPPL